MIATILVAIDASPQHETILDQAIDFARASGAEVHVATVADTAFRVGTALNLSGLSVVNPQAQEVEAVLRTACSRLWEQGVACQTHALSGMVSEQLADLARELQADLIVVGHRHLTWMQRLLDTSVGRDLVENAPCNVLIVKEGADAS